MNIMSSSNSPIIYSSINQTSELDRTVNNHNRMVDGWEMKLEADRIKTGYYITSNGVILYLANDERFYYKDPKGQWFVYYKDIFIPTKYFYVKTNIDVDYQSLHAEQDQKNIKKKKNKSLIFTIDPRTGANYIVQSMEDIYKLEFDLHPEEYSRLILALIDAGHVIDEN